MYTDIHLLQGSKDCVAFLAHDIYHFVFQEDNDDLYLEPAAGQSASHFTKSSCNGVHYNMASFPD